MRQFLLFMMFLVNVEVQALNIHVFGDSHSGEFAQIPHCQVRHLGPITMHRIGRDGLSFLNLRDFGVQEKEIAIFSFGEIDVRCHIGKLRDKHKRSLDDIIEELSEKYLKTILDNKSLYNDVTCIIYSVTPPTSHTINYDFPIYGCEVDRVNITKKLNGKLKELCSRNDLLFLDVYDYYSKPNGSLNPHLSDGNVHINPNCYHGIKEKLDELLKDFEDYF